MSNSRIDYEVNQGKNRRVTKFSNPLYLLFRFNTKSMKTIDVGGKGIVLVDFNDKNEIIGVEILKDGELVGETTFEVIEVEDDGK